MPALSPHIKPILSPFKLFSGLLFTFTLVHFTLEERYGYLHVAGQQQMLTRLRRIQLLNGETWTKWGGLPICPEVHKFFTQAAHDKTTICEVGMGSGVSALLFLLGSAKSTVHEFDLGDETKYFISKYLQESFSGRFKPHWGDFHVEIPKAPMICDLIYVDALHPDDIQLAMQHLGGTSAEWLYHNGGGGDVKTRDYLLSKYRGDWIESAMSNTSRTDGARCVYYRGQIAMNRVGQV